MTPEYEKLTQIMRTKNYIDFIDNLDGYIRPSGEHMWEIVMYDVQEFILGIIKELDNEQ